jgi:hypothetical protein
MATTIVTKNSSTASAVPTAGQLVQGELAVNVADKKLYTEDNAGSIIVLADGVKLAGIEALADVTDTANVTAAGALMDSELTSIASVKALNQGVATTDSPTFAALTSTGEITANGGIALGDNDVATFGDDDDLRISHDGTHSKIQEVGTGDLKIQASNLLLEAEDGTNYIYAVDNGSVRLYHPDATNGIKLTTTSTGIDVTGQINASTNLVAGTSVYSNNGVYYGSSTLSLKNSSAGSFVDFASNGNATFFGTATMDGLTSQLTADAQGKFSGWSPTGSTSTAHGAIELGSIASYQGIIAYDGSSNTRFLFDNSWSGTGSTFEFRTNTAATAKTHLKVEGTGDISFYEDTGTTAKLFWDASAESLGIGTTSPSLKGHINNASSGLPATSGTTQTNGVLRLSSSATSGIIDFGMNSSSPWIQATDYTGLNNNYNLLLNPNGGNVGIGTSSPAANRSLHVSSAPQNQARFERTGASTVQIEFQDSTTTNQPSLGGDGDSLTFRTSFTERLRIDSSGNVGINETVPFGKLHISDTQTGRTTADSAGNLLVLEDDENGMSILSADAGAGYILFGDTASSASGGIVYDHSANKFNFRTNEAWNRMILDSSGNLLVGKTAVDFSVDGVALQPSGVVGITRDGGVPLILNRKTSDGDIVNFQKSGAVVGSIGTVSGLLGIGSGDAILAFDGTGNAMYPMSSQTGGASNGVLDFGSSLRRFKDLYLSGGVYLGGTGAANHLDDYEEGTWTPTWTPASGSGQTISTASGWYTKTGNRVFVDIHLATNGHGTASGDLTLGGLPFTQTTNSGQNASLSCGQAANAGLVAGQAGAARVNQSATTITPLVWSATTGTTTMTAAQWGVSGTWRFTGSYQV